MGTKNVQFRGKPPATSCFRASVGALGAMCVQSKYVQLPRDVVAPRDFHVAVSHYNRPDPSSKWTVYAKPIIVGELQLPR